MPRANEYRSLVARGMCAEGCGKRLPVGYPWRRCRECLDERASRARHGGSARRPRKTVSSAGPRTLPRRQRVAIAQRDGWRCHYCSVDLRRERKWHVDHLVPASRGGSNQPSNLAASCVLDNLRKGDMTEEEYRAWLDDYGSNLPNLSENMWAAIGAVRALVRKAVEECPAWGIEHMPCDECRTLANAALADIHARGLFGDCRTLMAIDAPAPAFDDTGRSHGCRTCTIVCDVIWGMLRLREPRVAKRGRGRRGRRRTRR